MNESHASIIEPPRRGRHTRARETRPIAWPALGGRTPLPIIERTRELAAPSLMQSDFFPRDIERTVEATVAHTGELGPASVQLVAWREVR